MIYVCSRKQCRAEGCSKGPSFGVTGSKEVEYCAGHAPDGMVNVKSRKCRTVGCSKGPSFGKAGSNTGEYCSQHAPDGMVKVKSKKQRRIEGLKKNLNAPRPSEHPPVRGKKCQNV